MIVDNLKSCYTTTVRLRKSPQLLATIRWYFAPPGALPLPTPTAFGSLVWDTDWFSTDNGDLGETSLTRTWDKGVAPPGVTGQSTPTPLDWFVHGVPAGVTGPLAPCPGVLPAGPLLWWRPEEIQGLGVGGVVATWKPAPTTLIAGVGTLGSATPEVVLGPSGRAAAHLHYPTFPDTVSKFLSASPVCPVGTEGTLFVVGWTVPQAGQLFGPSVGSNHPFTQLILISNRFWQLAMGVNNYSFPTNLQGNTVSVWRYVRTGGSTLGLDLATVQPYVWTPVQHYSGFSTATGQLDLVTAYAVTAGFSGDFYLHEILYYPRALGAPELAAVDTYLQAKYGSNLYVDYSDMLIGQIIIDGGGDNIPALFVPAYGQRLSQVAYSLLFGRFGFLYGPNLNDGTFAVPDLRGKVVYGSGFAYATGQLVGNDSPTLTTAQTPPHTHGVHDTGHAHATGGSGQNFFGDGGAGQANPGVGQATSADLFPTTAIGITGISILSTPAATPVDVRQAGVALRPLIYAGQ